MEGYLSAASRSSTEPFFCGGFGRAAQARSAIQTVFDRAAQAEQYSLQEKGMRGPAFRKNLVAPRIIQARFGVAYESVLSCLSARIAGI